MINMILGNLAKMANLAKLKNEYFKCHCLLETSFLTPFKEAENRFSISCLVCPTELTQHTTYEKVLIYFEEYMSVYLMYI